MWVQIERERVRRSHQVGSYDQKTMLVSYKWIKTIGGRGCAIRKSWLRKMSTSGIEVEGVRSYYWSLKKVSSESLVLWRCAETHLHICQVNVGEEEARQIVCEHQMCVQTSEIWWPFRVLALRITYWIKRKNPWFRVTGDDLFTGEWAFLTPVYLGIRRWHPNLTRWCGTRWGYSLT